MKRRTHWVYPALVNYKVWLTAVVLALFGVALVWLSTWVEVWVGVWGGLIVRELGGGLFGIGVIAFAWELVAKRAFLHEILDCTGMSHELEKAGITLVTQHYLRDVDWPDLLKRSDRLDIFFGYAQTWRNNLTPDLKAFVAGKRHQIRLVLPNPDNENAMRELALRYSSNPEKVAGLIRETADFFRGLQTGEGSSVSVQYVSACPLLSLYIFDDVAILAIYTHRRERVAVPTFQATKGKLVYEFASQEFEGLVRMAEAEAAAAARQTPPPQPPAAA